MNFFLTSEVNHHGEVHGEPELLVAAIGRWLLL
jgi:hypothetical protein